MEAIEIEATMQDKELATFLQWALPRLRLRWKGFRKVRRQAAKRLNRRLEELELQTLDQYRRRLENDPMEWGVLDGLCHITISCFYRDNTYSTYWARGFSPNSAKPRVCKTARSVAGARAALPARRSMRSSSFGTSMCARYCRRGGPNGLVGDHDATFRQ